MMKESKPSYYAVIPANVRYDSRLKANEKLLYGEITALSQANGICWANNKYFANLYNVSTTSISKWVSNLVKFGYLKNVLIFKEGTKQIEKRYLTIVIHPIEEKFNTPIEEKLKDNNTSINNTSNKTPNPLKGEIDFDVLISIINKATGKSYRVINNATKKKYLRLLKEGYTKEDIRNAIKNSINDQYHKETKLKYLTPEFFSRPTTIDKYAFKSRFKQPNSSTSKGML